MPAGEGAYTSLSLPVHLRVIVESATENRGQRLSTAPFSRREIRSGRFVGFLDNRAALARARRLVYGNIVREMPPYTRRHARRGLSRAGGGSVSPARLLDVFR